MDSFYIYMNEDATKDMFNVKFDCYHYGASKIDARPAKLTVVTDGRTKFQQNSLRAQKVIGQKHNCCLKESKKVGKQSFMYAWVLDETGKTKQYL